MKVRNLMFRLLPAIVLLLFGGAVSETGGEEHADAARVLALETLWNQAEVNKDARALSQLVADTFTYVDIDGSLSDKPGFLKLMAEPKEQLQELKNESVVAHGYPNTVVVTGVYSEKGKFKGKAYARRGRFTDTRISENGAWLCVGSQSTLVEK